MKKKLLTAIGALGVALVSLPLLVAFEAHVINVTAQIDEGVLTVPLAITFGTVFPQQKLDKTFDIAFSQSFLNSLLSQGSNLLTNGSFETPDVPAGSPNWNIYPSGTSGLGWTVEWEPGQLTTFASLTRPDPANLELHNSGIVPGWLSQEGSQYSELDTDWFGPSSSQNGEPALVKIYQDIATIPGEPYSLSYYFSPRPDQTNALENTLFVRVNGVQIDIHTAVGNGSNTSWTQYTNNFLATGVTTRIEFAAGGPGNSLGVFLDNVSFVKTLRLGIVNYTIRQKPKCGLPVPATNPIQYSDFKGVTGANPDGTFTCPNGYVQLPLLCPYLSKHETTVDGTGPENDGPGINAFHGLPLPWTETTAASTDLFVYGVLSSGINDIKDTWDVDLKVPCFRGECAQDWANFVKTESGNPLIDPELYKADPAQKGQIFGCDLWVEGTAI